MRKCKHGESHGTPEYRLWTTAKNLCYRPTTKNFKHVGGRGIVMSEEWKHDYAAFLRDMGRRPKGLTLRRLDATGPYSKANCRWMAPRTRRTHGEASSPGKPASVEYCRWSRAKHRCYNPRNNDFKYYGGRGIVMCNEWKNDYSTFLRDMGRCPPGMSLDRLDVDGPYSKDNCRWASPTTQRQNRRDAIALFCKRGHPRNAANLGYQRARGLILGKFCRVCNREAGRRGDARKWARLILLLATVLPPLKKRRQAIKTASGARLRNDRLMGRETA